MQIPLTIDPSADQSLTSQIAGQLRESIVRGRIAGGTKLPSSRRLSEQLGVSRNTVVRAYEELCSEGYVEARPASCVSVAVRLPDSLSAPAEPAAGFHGGIGSVEMPMPAMPLRCQRLVNRNRSRLSFDFFPGRPNPGLFPIKIWRRLAAELCGPWRSRRAVALRRSRRIDFAADCHRRPSRRDARHCGGSQPHRGGRGHPRRHRYRGADVPEAGHRGGRGESRLPGRLIRL